MNEDFITYELAVKLKEKGFPQVKENTLAMYNEDGEWFSLAKNLDDFEYLFEDFDDRDCVCPTISQVLKWLRDEKNIYVSILPFATHSTVDKVAFYYLIEYNSTGETMEGIEQNTYCAEWKDAALAGIEYVLDNLI